MPTPVLLLEDINTVSCCYSCCTFEDLGAVPSCDAQLLIGSMIGLQLRQIARWRDACADGLLQDEIRQQLVKQLAESGHANAEKYSGPPKVGSACLPLQVQYGSVAAI